MSDIQGLLDQTLSPIPSFDPGQALPLFRQLEDSADDAVSPKGAVGRYQILPSTAKQYGFDPSKLKDPVYNTQVAATVLQDLHGKYNGDLDKMMVAYNAGPGRVADFEAKGASALPKETQDYLTNGHKYLATQAPASPSIGDLLDQELGGQPLASSPTAVAAPPPPTEPPQAAGPSYAAAHPGYQPPVYSQPQLGGTGPLHDLMLLGQGVREGVAGIADLPRNAAVLGNSLGNVAVRALGGTPGPSLAGLLPSMSQGLEAAGLANNPSVQPQGFGERLLENVGRAGPWALAGGLPAAASAFGGNVLPEEAGPAVAARTHLPPWLVNLGLGAAGGLAGGNMAAGIGRGIDTAMAGGSAKAIAGSSPLNFPIEPGTLEAAAGAKAAGLDVPPFLLSRSQAVRQSGGAAGEAAIDNAYSQFNRLTSQQMGEDLTRIKPGDLSAALNARGQDLRQAIQPVSITPGTPAGVGLVNDLGNMELKLLQYPGSASREAVDWFKDQRDHILNLMTSRGGINGDQYFDLTRFKSPISAAMQQSGPVPAVARDLRTALDKAADASVPAGQQGDIASARFQYRFGKALESPVRNAAPDGNLNPQDVFNSVSREFGITKLDQLPNGYGDVVQAGQFLPRPTLGGGVPSQTGHGASWLQRHSILAGGLAGVEASGLAEWAMSNPTLATTLGVGGAAAAPALLGLKALQRSYAASPQALQKLIELSQGQGTPLPGMAAGGIGAMVGAGR